MAIDFARVVLLPLLVPILVGIGSASVTVAVVTVRLEERVGHLERNMAKHETSLERDFTRHETSYADLVRRADDQERRLTRTEAAIAGMSGDVAEIKTDVKTLIRDNRDKK